LISKINPRVIEDTYKKFNAQVINRLELERLRSMLLVERSTFFAHWQELGRYIFPRRTRFYTTDVDKGTRRNQSIIDSTGGLAARTLRSGMISSFTSPSRPWFRLTTLDPDLAKRDSVKEWLYDVTWLMSDVFFKSNVYNSLSTVYGDIGVFGTGAMLIEESFTKVIHTLPFTIGSYYIFADDKLKINGFMRDFRLTVRQIVEKFGMKEGSPDIDWTGISGMVKRLWEMGTTEAWIEMSHGIIPNPDWNPDSPLSDKKKYMSVYYERGSLGGQFSLSDIDTTKVLQKKGYDKFRVLVPRWEVSGEDIYGTYCPGMEALGDIQGLQMYERRAAQALEKSINPPMVGPASLRNSKASVLPGDITYIEGREGQQSFTPAYQIQPNFQQLEAKEEQIRQRIKKCFHEDLWLVISNMEKGNVTAEEIRALQQEKLQEIGPVVDRLNQDLLDPLIENTFDIMQMQRMLPPPPQEMSKMPLKIEYVSIMHQAQKALAASGIERFWSFASQIRQAEPENPDVLDKINVDELIDHYGDALTTPPGVIRDDDEVEKIRAQRQQAMAQQQKMAQIEQASKAAKNLGGADTSGQNALTDLIDQGQAGNLMPAR
jgi:hypothetical protein